MPCENVQIIKIQSKKLSNTLKIQQKQIMKVQNISEIAAYFPLPTDASRCLHDILNCSGPTLQSLSSSSGIPKPQAHQLACLSHLDTVQSDQKTLLFGGSDELAFFNSFAFVLLSLAYKQVNQYPHLLTLIKQQFFKPGAFASFPSQKRKTILNVCQNIQIQLISAGKVEEFCQNNLEFLEGFEHVLKKIVGQDDIFNFQQAVQKIRRKFIIDCRKVFPMQTNFIGWALGLQKPLYIFIENKMIVVVRLQREQRQQKANENNDIKFESQKQFSDIGQLVIPQASQQSTPKFKQNQQSIRYRKKSHKNSFGGTFQIANYNQLANVLKRSEIQKNATLQPNKKVLSMKFEVHQLFNSGVDKWGNNDEGNQRCQDEDQFKQGRNIATDYVHMRGSNIEGNQGRFPQPQQQQHQKKKQRKKYITSSQMYHLNKDIPNIIKKLNIEKKQCTRMEGQSQPNNQYQQSMQNSGNQNKESFKFSFSKKDLNRFVFKEIQSQYNEEIPPQHIDLPRENNILRNHQPMRSSLTNLNSHKNSAGLLSEGEYYKKRQNNRKSLMLDAMMSPIKQQVQSSQQEDQSITQSLRDQEQDDRNLKDTQGQKQTSLEQPRSNQQLQNEQSRCSRQQANKKNITGPNYIRVLKAKNRKFSYLTQQVSMNKNSIGHVEQNRNCEIEEHEQIGVGLTSPKNYQPSGYIKNKWSENSKNRKKSPKIHKKSEAITESKPNKRRFEQNPISFSQMIANVAQPEQSNFSATSFPKQKLKPKLTICSKITQFTQNSKFSFNEPSGWIKKQVTYIFPDVFDKQKVRWIKRAPKKFIFQRVKQQAKKKFPFQNVLQKKPKSSISLNEINNISKGNSKSPRFLQANIIEVTQNFIQNPQNISQTGNSQNNIRSTIDTTINPTAKTQVKPSQVPKVFSKTAEPKASHPNQFGYSYEQMKNNDKTGKVGLNSASFSHIRTGMTPTAVNNPEKTQRFSPNSHNLNQIEKRYVQYPQKIFFPVQSCISMKDLSQVRSISPVSYRAQTTIPNTYTPYPYAHPPQHTQHLQHPHTPQQGRHLIIQNSPQTIKSMNSNLNYQNQKRNHSPINTLPPNYVNVIYFQPSNLIQSSKSDHYPSNINNYNQMEGINHCEKRTLSPHNLSRNINH